MTTGSNKIAIMVLGALWLLAAARVEAQGFTVDHTCTDIDDIPAAAIVQARSTLHIAYGHTSHGSQLVTGMSALVAFMNGKEDDAFPDDAFTYNSGGSSGALDLRDTPFSGASDLGNPNRTAWATATRTYLDADPDVNVIIWSWCGQVDGTEADIETYLSLMSALEVDYPDVRFVYMTGHLTGTGATGNVNLRNNQIREYCLANNKVLYDFADIESYDPDGLVDYMTLLANDNCDYDSDGDGSRDRNWATDWQGSHVEGVDWYSCSAAHSQALNGNRKAYAAWHLWARLAGWDGAAESTETTYHVSNDGDDSADGLTPETAWRTLAHVGSRTFQPGDSVLLRRGDTWREQLVVGSSGTSDAWLTFGAYGSGDKPRILGSTAATGWTQVATNIWRSSSSVSNPYAGGYSYAEVFFEELDGTCRWGRQQDYDAAFSTMTAEYDWCWNANQIYVCSPADPSTRYGAVEVPQRTNGVSMPEIYDEATAASHPQWVAFDNLEIMYAVQQGIYVGYNEIEAHGLRVTNCHIGCIGVRGGSSAYGIAAWYSDALIQDNVIHDCGRRGVSYNTYTTYTSGLTVSNVIIDRNQFYGGYHTTGPDISTMTGRGHTFTNFTISNNIIDDTARAATDIDDGCSASSCTSNSIYVESNGNTYTGFRIIGNVVLGSTSRAILLSGIDDVAIWHNTIYGSHPGARPYSLVTLNGVTNCDFQNNIIHGTLPLLGGPVATNDARCVLVTDGTTFSVRNHNLYYQDDPTQPFSGSDGAEGWDNTMSDWDAWKTATGYDLASPAPADPLFVDAAGGDVRLQEGSPAVDAGADLGVLDAFSGNAPDIGAFESLHVAVDSTPPAAPTSLSGVASADGGIDLSWTASTDNVGVASYAIYRNGVLVDTTSDTSWHDTGLVGDTVYHYVVVARDGAGNSSTTVATVSVATNSGLAIGPEGVLPATLSATGLFSDVPTLAAAADLVAYEVNLPAWSDYATARHWVRVPSGTSCGFAADGHWTLPEGALWVQHFEIETVCGDEGSRLRLETRVLVRTSEGVFGLSYRWNDAQTDAVFVDEAGADVDLVVRAGGGDDERVWSIPSRASCVECHTAAGGYALGVNTRQLNRSPDGASQLTALATAGVLDSAPDDIDDLPAHPRLTDTLVTLEVRARAWLDVNCASCHQPAAGSSFDLRSDTLLTQSGLIDGAVNDDLGDVSMRLIVADYPEHSAVVVRAQDRGTAQMPPVGTHEIDPLGTTLVTEWVLRLAQAVDAFEGQLGNLSTRGIIRGGDSVMIGGFVISGTSARQLLLRGVGPELAAYGVGDVVPDTEIELFQGSTSIGYNDDWGTSTDADAIRAAAAAIYAFPLTEGSRDAALLATLAPGSYTVHVRGAAGSDAVGMFEVYDLSPLGDGRLVNLSTRLRLGTGERVAIPGLIVDGDTRRTFLIRAVGPGLAAFGVTETLADPRLTLMEGSSPVASNDDWGSADGAAIALTANQLSAFALEAGSRDAALLITLDPGLYTVVTEGADATEGVVLVEIYEVL